MDLGVKGKVYLLAGASRGLGYAIGESLAAEGAKLSISSRDAEALAQRATTLSDMHDDAEVVPYVCDMTSADSISAWVNDSLAHFGRIDGVLVNGGGPQPGVFDNFDDAAWQSAFELTLLSAVRLVRATLPSIKESKGSVLMLTSSSVKEPMDMLLLSNVMRSGVNSLAKSLSRTLAAEGVRFNCIVPGMVETDRIRGLTAMQAEVFEKTVEQQKAEMEGAIPFGRFGQPEEFGRAGAFLLSPAASYITGTNMVVDGGAMRSV